MPPAVVVNGTYVLNLPDQQSQTYMSFFIRILFSAVLLVNGAQLLSQDETIDSLLIIPESQRDSLWIATLANTSFSTVYASPDYTARALEEALQTAQQIGNRTLLPRILLIRGIAEDVKDQSDSAVFFYYQALEVAKENQDTIAEAGAYNNIGLVYWNRKKLDSALIFYRESERLFEAAGGKRGLMSTMNNIGMIYSSMHRVEPALRYFRQLLATSHREKSLYFESVAYTNIASTYTSINQHDSVLYYAELAVPLQKEDGNLWGVAKSHYSIGQALEGLNEPEKAREAFYNALDIQKQLNNKKGIVAAYVFLAWNYRSAGNADKFMEYMLLAQEFEGHYDDIKLKTNINEALAWHRVRTFDPELFSDLIGYSRIKDSLYNAHLEGKILNLQEAYESEKKEQRIETQLLEIEAERRKNRTQLQIGALLAGIALALILALIAFVLYRRKLAALEKQQALHGERLRISRDLHDNVGAHLTSIAMRIDMLDSESENAAYQPNKLKKIQQEAEQSIAFLRDTIWAINQQHFQLQDFIRRVEHYSKNVLPPHIKTSVVSNGDTSLTLNSLEALNLFRIVQEALQNVVKHADASEVSINFMTTNKSLTLTITDNGKGWSQKQQNDSHYGLENMKERMQSIGGTMQFDIDRDNGFSVIACLQSK